MNSVQEVVELARARVDEKVDSPSCFVHEESPPFVEPVPAEEQRVCTFEADFVLAALNFQQEDP